MNRTMLGFCLAAMLLTGCSDDTWQTRDISGLMPPLEFSLTDENGEHVQALHYQGKATLLFFGYTSCPDICPTTLARYAGLLRQLSASEQSDIQVLFVSVDPKRDTPERLKAYASAFGPQFVGLTGTQDELRALNKRYRVTYGYGEPDATGFYEVSHSAAMFGFTADGKPKVMMLASDSDEAVLADIHQLISGT